MKKLLTTFLIAAVLFGCLSAFAAELTVFLPITLPTELTAEDLNKPASVDPASITISPERAVDVVRCRLGYVYEVDEEMMGYSVEINHKYYVPYRAIKPTSKVTLYYLVSLELTDTKSLYNLLINGEVVRFEINTYSSGIYDYYATIPIGTIDAEGNFTPLEKNNAYGIDNADIVDTGDTTPVAALFILLLLGAAGLVVFCKRGRA